MKHVKPQDTSPQRAAFEQWALTQTGVPVRRVKKGYIDPVTRVAWRAWQASSEAPHEARSS